MPLIRSAALRRAGAYVPPPAGDLAVVGSSGVKSVFAFTVPVPAGTQDGDLMLAFVARRSNSTAPNLATQGWTPLEFGTGTSGNTLAWLYSKVASSEPATYSIASGGHAGAAIVTLRNGSIDASALDSGGSSSSYEAPSVAASEAPGILVCFWVIASGTVSADLTPPGTMTTLQQAGDTNLRFALAWEAFASAGALGVRTATGPAISGDRTGISVAVV
ncbi:MAG TPA: hypothetical protein VF164_01155 [Trueperaceae bacterium]